MGMPVLGHATLSKEQAMASRQGDLYWPVQNGVITWDKLVAITDVLAGKAEGRTDDIQIILYKNQGGQGIIDLALAKRCYELARESGKGHEIATGAPPVDVVSDAWEERRYNP